IGDVSGRTCVVVDDIVDTAGTLTEAATALKDAGAAVVSAAITHPVRSGPAIKRIRESSLTELVITDTVPLRPEADDCDQIRVVSLSRLPSAQVRRLHRQE